MGEEKTEKHCGMLRGWSRGSQRWKRRKRKEEGKRGKKREKEGKRGEKGIGGKRGGREEKRCRYNKSREDFLVKVSGESVVVKAKVRRLGLVNRVDT